MIITKIERQRKNEKCFSVFIDNKFMFGLSDVDILFYKLKEREEISHKKLNYLLDTVIFTKARDKALHFLGYKGRTIHEVSQKLESLDYSPPVISRVLEMLLKYNYLDDYKYTMTYIKERLTLKGYGIKRIVYELKIKGVEKNIIDKACEELQHDINDTEQIVKLIFKKSKDSPVTDPKEKRKIVDFLLRRGFTYDMIENAFKEIDEGYHV